MRVVLCGTDFSESARTAATVAAALAVRSGGRLVLGHVVDPLSTGEILGAAQAPVTLELTRRLEEEARRIALPNVQVDTRLLSGAADEALAACAHQVKAELIVVGALGWRKSSWRLGSAAERLVQTANLPVLVASTRTAASADWVRVARPLRIMAADDMGFASEPAVRWAGELAASTTGQLVVVHVGWPPGEASRMGLRSLRQDVLDDTMTRHLGNRARELASKTEARTRVQWGFGRVDDDLLRVAGEEHADLLVLGTHGRSAWERLQHGSVSRGVLERSDLPVVLVPTVAPDQLARWPLPRMATILAPTDLSPLAELGVRYAYAIAGDGATVHLLHVASGPGVDSAAALEAAVPVEAASRRIQTVTHNVQSTDTPGAIRHLAERIGADAICMGTHGRSGVTRTFLGSVSRAVLETSTRPVMLVRPTERG